MAAAPLLRYPQSWGGSIKCTSTTFDLPTCGYNKSNKCQGPNLHICACHQYCEDHCTVRRTALNLFVGNWYQLLAPYSNLSACDAWSHQVVSDAVLKLNAFDPDQGLNVLQALMVVKDDVLLCKTLLELGVNPNVPFVPMSADVEEQLRKQNKGTDNLAVPSALAGGTAVHFAAHFLRKDCLEAMLEAGADLKAKTNEGLTPLQFLVEQEFKDELVETISLLKNAEEKPPEAHSFCALAKNGKWHALRYRMRTARVKPSDLTERVDGKPAVEWIWHHMGTWQFSMKLDEDSLAAFKIMSEMNYRYGQESTSKQGDVPAVMGRWPARDQEGSKSCSDEVVLVMEAVHLLKQEIAEMKGTIGSLECPTCVQPEKPLRSSNRR